MLSEFSKMRVESTPAGPASSMQPLLTSSVYKKDLKSYNFPLSNTHKYAGYKIYP